MTARSTQPPPKPGWSVSEQTEQTRECRGNFPVRTCVGCKERAAKSSLLRLVAAGDDIVPDPHARQPGRGAYLHPSLDCLDKARRRRVFSRALRVKKPLGTDPLVSYLSQGAAIAGNTEHASKGLPADECGRYQDLSCMESRSRS